MFEVTVKLNLYAGDVESTGRAIETLGDLITGYRFEEVVVKPVYNGMTLRSLDVTLKASMPSKEEALTLIHNIFNNYSSIIDEVEVVVRRGGGG